LDAASWFGDGLLPAPALNQVHGVTSLLRADEVIEQAAPVHSLYFDELALRESSGARQYCGLGFIPRVD